MACGDTIVRDDPTESTGSSATSNLLTNRRSTGETGEL